MRAKSRLAAGRAIVSQGRMLSNDERSRADKGALLTSSASSLAAIARDLSVVVDTLEADWQSQRIVRRETADRLREILKRAQQIARAAK